MNKREEWLEKKYAEGFIYRNGGVFEPDNIIKEIDGGGKYISYLLQHRTGTGVLGHWWRDSSLEDIIASREEVVY